MIEKGKHFFNEECVNIKIPLKDGWSVRAIAGETGCSPATVSNDIKCSTVHLYNAKVTRYEASAGQTTYEQNRLSYGRHYDLPEKDDFVDYVISKVTNEHWSYDACVGRVLETNEFAGEKIICTRM